MGKMHELLAVESSKEKAFNENLEETKKVFAKPEAFRKTAKTTEFFAEDDKKFDAEEFAAMTTTVPDRLHWFSGMAIDLYDLMAQRDKTNQKAVADLVVDGKTIAKDVPAVTLLALETKLQQVRAVLDAAPTLPSTVDWEKAPSEGRYIFKQKHPTVTFKTKKVTKPVILYPATEKHPAQVKEVSEDINVAEIKLHTWSGMISSQQKADMLTRLDRLLCAAKQARQRANQAEVESINIGKPLFDYIFGDIVSPSEPLSGSPGKVG